MRLKKLSRSALAALGLSLAFPFAVGCVTPITHIARGEPFSTGDPKYDEFFSAVRKLRAEALEAEVDEQATRSPLVKALGLEDKATAGAAVSEAELRAKKLGEAGVLLHLEITPDAKLFTQQRKTPPNAESKALLEAIEKSAKDALALSKRLGAIEARSNELEKMRAELREKANTTFRADTEARRGEILNELDSSRDVLAESAETGRSYAALSSKFVIDLARAVETGAKVSGAGAAPTKPPPKKSWSGGGRRPSGGAPSKPAAPPKKPKPSDDFEP